MKRLLSIGLLLFSLQVNSQSIKDLEYDLSWFDSSEKFGDRIAKARTLLKLDPFSERAIDYICRYYQNRKIDSITVFFNDLIRRFPSKTEPLILRAKFLSLELDYNDEFSFNSKKILILKKALQLDKSNVEINYSLAKLYYNDFIRPYAKEPDFGLPPRLIDSVSGNRDIANKRSFFPNSNDSALFFLKEVGKLDKRIEPLVYFPIKQLEFFKNRSNIVRLDTLMGNGENCFFPIWYFANLKDNWFSDLSIDYLFTIEQSKRYADWLKIQLVALEEPCLYNKTIPVDLEIYRFTWLRSFDNPISIKIVKSKNEIGIIWKVGEGEGGYEPKGLRSNGNKIISDIDFLIFLELFNHLDINHRPNNTNMMMTDGASWILEKKTSFYFKGIMTNIPDESLKKCCLYLLKLADIQIDPKKIY